MSFPAPEPGLVVRYAFLWREEAASGQEEGHKDRPCAIVVTTRADDGDLVVTVVPVTHSPPADRDLALEIPAETKRRLGLDDQRSWIVLTDLNRFVWPGPDLRPRLSGRPETVAYGHLPADLFRVLRARLAQAVERRLAGIVRRSE